MWVEMCEYSLKPACQRKSRKYRQPLRPWDTRDAQKTTRETIDMRINVEDHVSIDEYGFPLYVYFLF